MNRRGVVPPRLRAALASPGGTCYRHCDRPIGIHHVPSRLPGFWEVRSCPSGVVSVTLYAERTRRDPTRSVRATLRKWTRPPSLVRNWDLRVATRHGPELGRAAERVLAKRTRGGIRIVYWRVYPFKARDGTARRVFVCFRRAHASPVFFAAPPESRVPRCPVCGRASGTAARRAGC